VADLHDLSFVTFVPLWLDSFDRRKTFSEPVIDRPLFLAFPALDDGGGIARPEDGLGLRLALGAVAL
jgi:hypothetical protein